jgi:hypothetical protein
MPSSHDNPPVDDALVAVLAEVPAVPAEVPLAWATAAACPAKPVALVV